MSERSKLGLRNWPFLVAMTSLSALGCSAEMGDEALGSQSSALMASWDTAFSDANGWGLAKHYSTIRLADVSSDGRADVCGRSALGIICGTSTGSSFATATTWDSSFSDSGGWSTAPYYSTIRFPNVNGTGGKDVCGRGTGGINCALSTGSVFGAATVWASAFSDAGGWNLEKHYATIDFPDVNADGKADVCGRGNNGINCAISSGSTFGSTTLWNADLSDAGGWGNAKYYRTVKYPDVNGDGRSDVCGRGGPGIYCATSTGSTFGIATLWAATFSDANLWGSVQYYSTIAFPDLNGDGKADVCGRASTGVLCALSNGSSFGSTSVWGALFNDNNGFNVEQYYSTISFSDINGDGKADLCGRGSDGLYCGNSTGSTFSALTLVETDLSSGGGWNQAKHYQTLRFDNIDGDSARELCARGTSGILCKNF